MSRHHLKKVALLAFILTTTTQQVLSSWVPFPDTTLNVSQIASSMPERAGIYLGSPSIVRHPSTNTLIASHDTFGFGSKNVDTAIIFTSSDEGVTWTQVSTVSPMYWATLFVRDGDDAVYLIGTSDDGSKPTPTSIVLTSSTTAGTTWNSCVTLSPSTNQHPYSTGPTPIVSHNGRLWKAFEHNVAPGWASGYSAVVISAPSDPAVSLLDPTSWTLSGELPFSAVAQSIPPNWWTHNNSLVTPSYGWLESNAVAPVNDTTDGGINIMLRVNSSPAANKAGLLYLASPAGTPSFVSWVEFPGGNTKFTIRKDIQGGSGLYATLSNYISDDSATLPPSCGAYTPPGTPPGNPVPCCGFLETCYTSSPNCLWCHAVARNNLTLAVSTDLLHWDIIESVLSDDTGQPAYMSLLNTGFQYVDWQFDDAIYNDTLIYAVRAGYRGSNNFHNSNRNLFGTVQNWRAKSIRVITEGKRR